MNVQTTVDSLTHNGVKGMRWGVRKEQARQNFNAGREQQLRNKAYTTREITEQEYKAMSSKPIAVAEPGASFYRVAPAASKALRKDLVYVTKDENDHNTYKVLWLNKNFESRRPSVSLKVQTANAVVSPGKKERVSTFIKTLDDKIVDPKSNSVHTGREFFLGSQETNLTKSLSNREVGLRYYHAYTQHQHKNTPLTQAIFSKYKDRGYNAVVDDADHGFLSNSSVILFPEKSQARVVSVKPITRKDLINSSLRLNPPKTQ